MQSIFLENFKAFKEPLEITLEGSEKNILLYGENGAGKTSLYDALELFFFYGKLEEKATIDAIDATDEIQKRNDWLKSYLCKMASADSITVKVNDDDYDAPIDKSAYQVFMISNRSISFKEDRLSVKKLLQGIKLTDLDVDNFLQNEENRSLIELHINDILKKDFWEPITIKFDQDDEYCLEIIDKSRSDLKAINNLYRFFNEAKIKLISLLVLFVVAELQMDFSDNAKKKIIIIDDIINSLDASNRLMLMKYILKTFKGNRVQIVSMTHNVSYYNLWLHYIKEQNISSLWKCINIYVTGNKHKKIWYEEDNITSIKDAYKNDPSDSAIGNRLRQHFERLLYELAKIIQTGPFNESRALIDSIVKKKHIYLNIPNCGNAQDGYEMMEEIRRKHRYWTTCTWKKELKKILDKYNSTNQFDYLKNIIDEVVMYQKVALHQSSHGHTGINTIGDKEIRAVIYLLEKMETAVKCNRDKNVYTV